VNAVIDVYIEFAARLDAMRAAPVELVVSRLVLDARKVGKELSALRRVKHLERFPYFDGILPGTLHASFRSRGFA
jgi:hypothetical protein